MGKFSAQDVSHQCLLPSCQTQSCMASYQERSSGVGLLKFPPLKHLICLQQWNTQAISDVVISAMSLKRKLCDSHQQKLDILRKSKVMILQEINEPYVNMAVSKGASLLGADDVEITDTLDWDQDYQGRIFSDMADIIFVSTTKHGCIRKFAEKSSVPVLCMYSRAHAPIQAMATIMSMTQEFGSLEGLNIAYIGAPHPVLNSYLVLFPMLGANFKFKCCCKICPVSPLMMHVSRDIANTTGTVMQQCSECNEALQNASVIISGPTPSRKELLPEFTLGLNLINSYTCYRWIYFHTCPRGPEVDDQLFNHCNARTFDAFKNMQYIAAALMAYLIKEHRF
ncbi:hypothetical protein PYW07_010170 [Mythimna separata]|uniref:ornithine carbamoyltransferase n=1 Tax=Mythimna separata TaxID=271217 RepID=A0AAD7YI57_MYTSE|nr:hypothetical protein PYW07_010170 [Mythimna separata]